MTETTSSAGQLYKIPEAAFAKKSDKTTLHIWAEALNAEEVSYQKVSDKLSELFNLFSIVKKDILQLKQPYGEIGIQAISEIQSIIIKYGLTQKWNSLVGEINQAVLTNIKLCDGLLNQVNSQNILSKNKLKELLKQVENLIKEFHESDISSDFKLDLIRELIKIKTALITFEITGESHLLQVCNEVIGDIITKASEKPKLFKKFKGSVQKVVSMAVTIGGLMTTYDLSIKYQPVLADQIINLIENIPDETDDIQLKLEAVSKPQQMDAEIENNTNRKCLPSGEEE